MCVCVRVCACVCVCVFASACAKLCACVLNQLLVEERKNKTDKTHLTQLHQHSAPAKRPQRMANTPLFIPLLPRRPQPQRPPCPCSLPSSFTTSVTAHLTVTPDSRHTLPGRPVTAMTAVESSPSALWGRPAGAAPRHGAAGERPAGVSGVRPPPRACGHAHAHVHAAGCRLHRHSAAAAAGDAGSPNPRRSAGPRQCGVAETILRGCSGGARGRRNGEGA